MCFIVCSSFLLHSHPAPQGDPPAGGGGEGQEEGGEGGGGQGQEHLVPGQYLVPINLTPLFFYFPIYLFLPLSPMVPFITSCKKTLSVFILHHAGKC